MTDIPDSVIREASIAGAGAAERASKGVVERGRAKDRAFAEVIAGWAREQERERIRVWIEARHTVREAEMLEADRKAAYKDSPGWAAVRGEKEAVVEELRDLLDELDPAGTREGEQ